MKKAILDTSFILDCVKENVDFFEQLEMEGLRPVVPKEVMNEVERKKDKSGDKKIKEVAELALRVLDANSFESPSIGKGNVDKRIKDFAKKNPGFFLATTDKDLRYSVKNRKVFLRGKSKVEVQK